ncbi:uncharacterized protein EDB93DRAFT_1149677 [Suillus bovinus]|uniref:uncharacterized protein n=1 Tax=Suillus bovinus TaxID=48563 RepID=UPI001B8660CC|nr:uncharacterized protein EDB93DRAFT_1149677 [Suillus bovinus]KAG2146101.1 hypothetical protein EDB93DRAFT_1149677 [Suillus bovinus]
MHFSSAIVLAVIAALVSSSSAMPTTSDAAGLDGRDPSQKCPSTCRSKLACRVEGCCMTVPPGFWVSHILDFTSVEYGR